VISANALKRNTPALLTKTSSLPNAECLGEDAEPSLIHWAAQRFEANGVPDKIRM